MTGLGIVSATAALGSVAHAVDPDRVEAARAVFVPAVMGAGMVLSLATLLRDVVSQGRRDLSERRSTTRGDVVGAWVVQPLTPDVPAAARAAPRMILALTGAIACAFGVYVAIGTTGNFLRVDGYVSQIAWLWGASLALASVGLLFGMTCLIAAWRWSDAPGWVWPVLFQTPLVGVDDEPLHRPSRTLLVGGLTASAGLIILATWPHVLDPVDRTLARAIDETPTDEVEWIGRALGSTRLTLILAVLVGLATLRCRRFAWIYIVSVAMSLLTSVVIRAVVARPRPVDGPKFGGTDSFPSGHMVQATLLTLLLPLAVHELTRSNRLRRAVTTVLVAGLLVVAVVAISTERHHPTDVVAGLAIGVAFGSWARLALTRPGSHDRCTGCRYADDDPVRRLTSEGSAVQVGER